MKQVRFILFYFLKNIYFGCTWVLVAGSFSCGMWTLSCGMHVGSSSPTRDRICTPCIGSVESYPLDHQGSLEIHFNIFYWT